MTSYFPTLRSHVALILAMALSACGGTDGGVPSLSFPAAPPSAPTGPTGGMAPLAYAPDGVTTTTDLVSMGSLENVRWNATLNAYEVDVGPYDQVRIGPGKAESFAQGGNFVGPEGPIAGMSLQAWTGYRFTRSGYVNGLLSPATAFVFGSATPAGGVPTTGSASYRADLTGQALNDQGGAEWGLYGTATFDFNFAAGTLGGHMDPVLNGPMEVPPVPRYDFTDTHFGLGSTGFSGVFSVAGPTPSSFQGQFTGPNAEELMASFRAPYYDSFSGKWGEISGVMAGRR